MVNGKETTDKECRLCDYHTESQLHLLGCPKLAHIQQFVLSLLEAMGTKKLSTHPELTWLLGLDAKGSLLPSTHLALLRIYWRHVYAAMVRVKYDNEEFSCRLVNQNIARTFFSRILAHKHGHFLRFSRRRFSHQGKFKLSRLEATQIEPIGTLRLSDGHITIKKSIIDLLQQQNIDCQHGQDLPVSPAPSSRPSGGSSCSNNNNRQRVNITGFNGVQ
eukprot:5292261-Pleurochrysis_carterae.AAC.2